MPLFFLPTLPSVSRFQLCRIAFSKRSLSIFLHRISSRLHHTKPLINKRGNNKIMGTVSVRIYLEKRNTEYCGSWWFIQGKEQRKEGVGGSEKKSRSHSSAGAQMDHTGKCEKPTTWSRQSRTVGGKTWQNLGDVVSVPCLRVEDTSGGLVSCWSVGPILGQTSWGQKNSEVSVGWMGQAASGHHCIGCSGLTLLPLLSLTSVQ